MKALIYSSKGKIELTEKPKPKLLSKKDAIVKVSVSSICTSDLHIINGFVPKVKEGVVLGHEFVGVVDEIGEEVKNVSVGDRVSVNCETFCGECYFCKKGFINNCEKGGWFLGCQIDGCQAEYVRVPFADCGLNKLPCNVSDLNALFVGDILSSGNFGALMCDIKEGDSIAVIGAGPVGMCSMICAKIMGAKKIIAIDINEKRLEIAKSKGICTHVFNPLKSDIEKEIKNLTEGRGADGVIEAAGAKETFEMSWKIARPNGIVGVVAMYEENQILPLPSMYGKNLTFKTGGVDAVHCGELINLISSGKINTDFLITHKFKLENIIEAYEMFKKGNCLKIAVEG